MSWLGKLFMSINTSEEEGYARGVKITRLRKSFTLRFIFYFLQKTTDSNCLFSLFPCVICNISNSRSLIGYWRTDTWMTSWSIFSFVPLLFEKNRIHDAVRLFYNRSQATTKRGKNISDTLSYCLVCHLFALTFSCHLWSIAEQTHGSMEYIC